MIWAPLALCLLVLNLGYFIRKIRDDLDKGDRGMALLGVVCLFGLNALVVWTIYVSLASSTDL